MRFFKQFEGLRPTERARTLGDVLTALAGVGALWFLINLVGVHCA